MSRTPPSPSALRVSELSQTAQNNFDVQLEKADLARIAQDLELSALRKLRFAGQIVAQGKTDWQLTATLGATVVQPCVATLEPVTTRIDTTLTRLFVSDYADPEEPEAEMPEDDTVEPLGPWIDPLQVLIEALAIEVPDYPRKDSADLGQMVYTKPGDAPMTDEDAKPFAGLADLKAKLHKDDD